MSEMYLIRPARPGAKIFDPDAMGFLPDEGAVRARTPHWVGQEMNGEVTIEKVEPEEQDSPVRPGLAQPPASKRAPARTHKSEV